MSANVITLPVRAGRQELARLRAIEAAAAALVSKVEQAEACGYERMEVAELAPLRGAVRGDNGPVAS